MPPYPALTTRLRFAALLGFLRSEAAGGAVLILSAIAALLWANSPAGGAYRAMLHAPLLHETPTELQLLGVLFVTAGMVFALGLHDPAKWRSLPTRCWCAWERHGTRLRLLASPPFPNCLPA